MLIWQHVTFLLSGNACTQDKLEYLTLEKQQACYNYLITCV